MNDTLLESVIEAAQEAGDRILKDWRQDRPVGRKRDGSPVTETDRAAEDMVVAALKKLSPHTIVAEEDVHDGAKPDVSTGPFWLVDALDGTRDFIRGEPDFTVNIALVENGHPILGVIYAPVFNITWYASKDNGAFRISDDGVVKIEMPKPDINHLRLLGGVRSAEPVVLEPFIGSHVVGHRVQRSSSLKFCLVAEGAADIYPRLGPTSEWDTAAGDIIIREAGGSVLDLRSKCPILYGKMDKNFENEGFIAASRELFKI